MSSIPPSTPVIPSFNHSGVLPPFLGADPAGSSAAMSPYRVSIDSFVTTYATTPERSLILQGFLKFRRDLRAIGMAGWHWLDGSFLENIEALQSRAPHDLDVVTFFMRPHNVRDPAAWITFVNQNLPVLDRTQTKLTYGCDAQWVDLSTDPYNVISHTRYWFGLFSHQRVTGVWKGMLEIDHPLTDGDAAARVLLGVS